MKPRTLRAWSWVHKWSSLVSTAFLMMLCVTGLPLVFTHEIDEVLLHEAWAPANSDGQKLNLDQVLDVALSRHPGDVPAFVSVDEDRPVVNVTSRALPGMLFLGAMGLLLIEAIVSGVVLYAPFMRRLPFGTVRASKAARTRWLDYHNLLGVVTVAWVLVVGVTGVINTLAVPIITYWKDDALKELTQAYDAPVSLTERSSLDAAVERAKQALPGMTLQFVAFPGSTYSTENHYAVFFHGDTPLTEHLTTPALIDARTGELAAVAPAPWYVKTLSLSQPLHFGDYGGLPLKILWALLDLATIVILGSGLYLWWVKHRSVKRDAK